MTAINQEKAFEMLYWGFSSFLTIWPPILISFFVKKKSHYWIRLGCFVCGFLAFVELLLWNGIIYFNVWWGAYLLHLISFSAFFLLCDISLKEKCYLEVWNLAFQNLMAQLPGLVATTIDPEHMSELMGICKFVSAIVFYILAAFVIRFCISRGIRDISWWEVAQSFLITEGVARFNGYIFRRQEKTLIGIHDNMVFLLQAFAMLCVILVLFMQMEIHYRKKMQLENDMRERIWSLEKKQFEERKEQIDLINRKCHDLKHQIAALEYVSDKKDYQKSIQEIKDAVQMYDEDLHTGNLALETIIKEKKLQCEKEGIVLKCVVEGIPQEFMDVVDLYVLLGNIVDNTMESVMQLTDALERIIEIRLYRDRNMIRMVFRNRYKGTIRFDSGLPVSTKPQDGYHGFGLKSIAQIVEKYSGAMTIDTDNEVFLLKIMIPVPKEA